MRDLIEPRSSSFKRIQLVCRWSRFLESRSVCRNAHLAHEFREKHVSTRLSLLIINQRGVAVSLVSYGGGDRCWSRFVVSGSCAGSKIIVIRDKAYGWCNRFVSRHLLLLQLIKFILLLLICFLLNPLQHGSIVVLRFHWHRFFSWLLWLDQKLGSV